MSIENGRPYIDYVPFEDLENALISKGFVNRNRRASPQKLADILGVTREHAGTFLRNGVKTPSMITLINHIFGLKEITKFDELEPWSCWKDGVK